MSPASSTAQVPTSTVAYRVPASETSGQNPQGPRRRGWLRWVVLLVLLSLAGLITWRTITAKREEKAAAALERQQVASQAVQVQVAAVRQETVPIYLTGLGTIMPYYSVKIIPRVTGELTDIYFREGQDVRKGAELMTIDPRPYEAALDQAKGQLARDQAQLQNNQAEFNRYKALYDDGVVSKEQLGTYESNLGQFVGAIKSDQAAIESAQLNVAYCHIKSPIDGKIGLRQVDPGNLVTANTTQTLIVNQFRPIAVNFTLPEDQLQRVLTKLRRDHKLDAVAFDRSDTTQLESGQLTAADNQIDTTTGTDKLKAVFANQDERLFPNQFVNVHLILEQRSNAIIVPAAAVQHGTDNDFVWLVKPAANSQSNAGANSPSRGNGAAQNSPGSGTVVMQPVDIDTTQGSMVILKSGLEADQEVVVDGADKLQNDAKVSTTFAHRGQKQQHQQLGS
ncbi:MAG TPA: efflux RND transporter periplasmic adaptor subunit [Acidobacteriaceae bacterium]|nr:efflux RND transporter periplasmic adaptor subunit [Acidobacteriaceae bacterium]